MQYAPTALDGGTSLPPSKAVVDEGEKKILVQENKALRAQIQKMRIASENQERSRKDERLISSLRRKIIECEDDLEKSKGNLAKARAQLVKNAEGRAEFVRQLKRKYNGTATNLTKRLNTLENEMAKQAKNIKAKREHCYALMSQLEEDMQQLQGQNHRDAQVLEGRTQQIGRLLQEKGIIRERVRVITDYIVMKCYECFT
uniref:Tropomyosin-1-like n=1 Tax=Nicotiana sylvestris TaxID=4096 RepID=A0A1U7X6C9_NICSY|nr:PREDICTED: tropomyosin-1-like [Nicotiana sylvestris]